MRSLGACYLVVVLPLTAMPAASAVPPHTFRSKTVAEWQTLLKSKDAKVRGRAVTALGLGRFGKLVVPPLLKALRDPYAAVRQRAFSGLGDLDPQARAAIPVLAEFVRAGKSEVLSRNALGPLGRIGADAVPFMLILHRERRIGSDLVVEALQGVEPAAQPTLPLP